MGDWKNIRVGDISRIDKCVAEFQVWEIESIPSAKFKVKIYENNRGYFSGYTNIGLIVDGSPEIGVGSGYTIEAALKDTIINFMEEVTITKNQKGELTEQDFDWIDPHDF